jgi:hypothetical protein
MEPFAKATMSRHFCRHQQFDRRRKLLKERMVFGVSDEFRTRDLNEFQRNYFD